MLRDLRGLALCLKFGAISVSLSQAKTREETLDFLFRNVLINGHYFETCSAFVGEVVSGESGLVR